MQIGPPLADARPNVLGSAASPQFLAMLLSHAVLWRERARGRRLLQQLDDRMLRDVGMSRSDVERESAKFFWQR
jgi:uncharacterized protein YjiS (DUF1127 family)